MALFLLVALVPSIASSEGVLVLHGSHASSHPRFSVKGSDLVLHKRQGMHYPGGSGCRNTHPGFRCSLGPYGRVEIIMGPSDDKVEIDSPMPVPVTARLGGGSDKFIGNDEPRHLLLGRRETQPLLLATAGTTSASPAIATATASAAQGTTTASTETAATGAGAGPATTSA